jgi:hypothetical protein
LLLKVDRFSRQCSRHDNKNKDQWNTIENPKVNPHIDDQLIFKKVLR